jgi:hypothetical protein
MERDALDQEIPERMVLRKSRKGLIAMELSIDDMTDVR